MSNNQYEEIFKIEVDGWCYGIKNFPGEVSAGLVHRIIRELTDPFRAAIEHSYPFSVLDVASKISATSNYLIGEREVAFSILAQLPNPVTLSEQQVIILDKIVDEAEQAFGGVRTRIEKLWESQLNKSNGQETEPAVKATAVAAKKVVFISYSSSDFEIVSRIGEHLRNDNFRVWMDKEKLIVGDIVELRLEKSIEEADYLLFFCSQAAVRSDWVKTELNLAIKHRKASRIVPVLLENCELPYPLAIMAYHDFRNAGQRDANYEKLRLKLTDALDFRPQIPTLLSGDIPERLPLAQMSNTIDWSEGQLLDHLDEIKTSFLQWNVCSGSARSFWVNLEEQKLLPLRTIVRLAEELASRNASISEFFNSYIHSNTDNVQAILHYMDYTRIRNRDIETRMKTATKSDD